VITSLEVARFKCFEGLRLRFGAMTLLTGYNGGGKSTAVQPLLLLSQVLRHSDAPKRIPLNGSTVKLGTVGDVVSPGSSRADISFRVECPDGILDWQLSARAGERSLSVQRSRADVGDEGEAAVITSLKSLVYVSAVRAAPSEIHPIPDGDDEWRGNVGYDGRFAAYWLDRFGDDVVSARAKGALLNPLISIRRLLNDLLGELFPGAEANVQQVFGASAIGLQFRLSETGDWKRPINVGYGLSYALPILVALLTAERGQTLVVDSPEAHLHPAAQSRMGEILSRFAANGLQIVVETHSDHLLNGARLAVRARVLAPEDIQLHFFSGTTSNGHGVISPSVDRLGRVSEWPDGFFDQIDKDVSRLVDL
jgi:predicted ATPase